MGTIICSDNEDAKIDSDELEEILIYFVDEDPDLTDVELHFVEQMSKRWEQFGMNIYMTEKQLNWLKRIYKRCTF